MARLTESEAVEVIENRSRRERKRDTRQPKETKAAFQCHEVDGGLHRCLDAAC
jgi:hypothetical protein